MTTPSSNTQSNAQGSFGAMLQQARKTKQVSLEEAAAELFILKRHLQALENENFADLPQAAFARGFAINYAKFLGLDPIKVASSFDAAYPNELKARAPQNIESPLRPMGTLQRDTHNRIRFNPLLIIAVIGVIILAIFLFRMVSNASKDNNEQPVTTSEDISALEQAQGAAIDVDSNGVGSQTAGDYKLSGTPPFNVQIDNVKNVSLMLNEEAVALDSYATGTQASFELAP